jgi:hypothetical protein
VEKEFEDFHPSKQNKDGRTSHCKECRNRSRREYGRNHQPELTKIRREWYIGKRAEQLAKAKAYNLRRYGITLFEYDKMLDEQGGVCKICKEPPSKRFSLSVDHDHETGRVRGLLCGNCNFALGYAKDNPSTLRKMADYLEK